WLGPLTIGSSIAAGLATRGTGLHFVTVPRRFEVLNVGPPLIDTFLPATNAIFLFPQVAGTGHDPPRRRDRVIAVGWLVLSFGPDVLIDGTWPPKILLMAEHVAAWLVTVELLTRLA